MAQLLCDLPLPACVFVVLRVPNTGYSPPVVLHAECKGGELRLLAVTDTAARRPKSTGAMRKGAKR